MSVSCGACECVWSTRTRNTKTTDGAANQSYRNTSEAFECDQQQDARVAALSLVEAEDAAPGHSLALAHAVVVLGQALGSQKDDACKPG